MHIWLDLVTREGVFLLTLLALGAGPAAFLAPRVDSVVRLVFAPAFGLCVGVAVTLTLVQWAPVRSTYWVLIPCVLVSLGLAAWRVAGGRASFRLPLRALAQLVLVAAAVLGPASSTLLAQATVGPVAWNVYDAVGYVSEIDSEQTLSINAATALKPVGDATCNCTLSSAGYRNMNIGYWATYARGYQNMDASALEGSVNDLLGLYATDTQSPFLIVLVLVGALGAFGAFRYLARTESWAAVLAGGLYGGSFVLQLWADSSQAAICGLALLLPFVIVGAEALKGRRTDAVLLGILGAGLLSVYPLFVPSVVLASLIVLAVWSARMSRRSRPSRRVASAFAGRIAIVVLLAGALSPVAVGRDLRYWRAILQGAQEFSSLPHYDLNLGVIPGWLLQTQQFYGLSRLGVGGPREFLFAVLLPAVFLGVIALGLRWRPRALLIVPLAVVCAVVAEYVFVNNSCEYCVQRNLLPVAPIAIVFIALGIAGLAAGGTRRGKITSIVLALLIVAAVGGRMLDERRYILGTAYFLDSANRSVLAHLPQSDASVAVEGFGAAQRAPGELPLVTALVNERTGGHATVALDSSDYAQNAYIGPAYQPALLHAGYGFVLTRFAGVLNGRRSVARSGGIALQQRTHRLDVIPVADLGVPLASANPAGRVWLQGAALHEPLRFYVIGGSGGSTAWVHLGFSLAEPVTVPRQPGVASTRRGRLLSVCFKTPGTAPVRAVNLSLDFTPLPGPPLPVHYQLPVPAEGVQLTSVKASERPCRP